MLDEAQIPYENYQEKFPDDLAEFFVNSVARYGENGMYKRNQIIYGRHKNGHGWKFDGICQCGSYGAFNNMIETYGTLGRDEKNNPRVMTADHAFEIIRKDWNMCK